MFAGVKKIARELFSEPGPNGTLSWGRVASAVALVASVTWVSRILIHTGALPSLASITGFVTAPYASGKVGSAVQSFTDHPTTDNSVVAPKVLQGTDASKL